ncbi:hypothetical protein VP01_2002g1 [Puccinia sorghi]|uniref:Uncharacterized protein n=1 Tax=Puccinia sorghi TaxID=27349 RepID=A0A0L6VBY0_9BASI|nr:hypothetical protein VP01_2002g1 [Puccinia sorghi]
MIVLFHSDLIGQKLELGQVKPQQFTNISSLSKRTDQVFWARTQPWVAQSPAGLGIFLEGAAQNIIHKKRSIRRNTPLKELLIPWLIYKCRLKLVSIKGLTLEEKKIIDGRSGRILQLQILLNDTGLGQCSKYLGKKTDFFECKFLEKRMGPNKLSNTNYYQLCGFLSPNQNQCIFKLSNPVQFQKYHKKKSKMHKMKPGKLCSIVAVHLSEYCLGSSLINSTRTFSTSSKYLLIDQSISSKQLSAPQGVPSNITSSPLFIKTLKSSRFMSVFFFSLFLVFDDELTFLNSIPYLRSFPVHLSSVFRPAIHCSAVPWYASLSSCFPIMILFDDFLFFFRKAFHDEPHFYCSFMTSKTVLKLSFLREGISYIRLE